MTTEERFQFDRQVRLVCVEIAALLNHTNPKGGSYSIVGDADILVRCILENKK
jgi:hypothetical protein